MAIELLTPTQLSTELRTDASADMQRRRWVSGLSIVGTAIGAVVTTYQTGLIKHLPDILPGDVFDAEKVDASDYAYKRLQMPDAPQMMLTYSLTAALASAGGADRAEQNPALPITTAGKAMFDLVTCLALARDEWATNHKLCSWCQIATAISAIVVVLTVPEAVRAARAMVE